AVRNPTGVWVHNGSQATIGGDQAGAGNLISGNGTGVEVSGQGNAVVVAGNSIGVDASGEAALGNETGIHVFRGGATIGGTTAGARNLISGNMQGIFVERAEAAVEGNYIGTDATGTSALGNGTGIRVYACCDFGAAAGIGTGDPAGRNLISGNAGYGIV